MKELFEKQDKEFENWVDAQVFPPPKLKELPVIYWRRITKALVKKYISKVRQETLDWVKEEIEKQRYITTPIAWEEHQDYKNVDLISKDELLESLKEYE